MMELLRQWITGITAGSVLLAISQELMPRGTVRKVGSLAGGMLLMLTMITPLMRLDISDLAPVLSEYRMAERGKSELLEIENVRLVKAIIAEETAAYISDKATEVGAICTAEVSFEYGEDGSVYPAAVVIRGSMTAAQQEKMSDFILRELAIPKEKQTYEGVNTG